uniref:AlNc14C133G7014 protein n=1 Tax=Albugo laibachii Nc14 TaxID=890382 RepID=F0WKG3_9STRA|nr:AlNc14C133G7014 [Albugo laibachii Nc14]|eukprot:CCA21767.1 AlNc14C133G7014 [Albugo laibachii Nc14]
MEVKVIAYHLHKLPFGYLLHKCHSPSIMVLQRAIKDNYLKKAGRTNVQVRTYQESVCHHLTDLPS